MLRRKFSPQGQEGNRATGGCVQVPRGPVVGAGLPAGQVPLVSIAGPEQDREAS